MNQPSQPLRPAVPNWLIDAWLYLTGAIQAAGLVGIAVSDQAVGLFALQMCIWIADLMVTVLAAARLRRLR